MVVVLPLLVDVLRPDQGRRVVAADDAVVLLRQVERVGDAAEQMENALKLDKK